MQLSTGFWILVHLVQIRLVANGLRVHKKYCTLCSIFYVEGSFFSGAVSLKSLTGTQQALVPVVIEAARKLPSLGGIEGFLC